MSKRKNYIVLSTYIDSLIQEQMPDIDIQIFTSLQDISEYIDRKPLRADALFITREMFNPNMNTKISLMLEMLSNPFLKVKVVEYLTTPGAEELTSLEYILQEKEVNNWNINLTELTREKVAGLISGTLRGEDVEPVRKAVYRVRRDEFIKKGLDGNDEEMSTRFQSEEDELKDIPDERPGYITPTDVAQACSIDTITGLDTIERSIFSLLLAQYRSHTHKTVIVERDFEYLRVTEIAKKANIQFLDIPIQDLYGKTMEVLTTIRNTSKKLIIITCSSKSVYDYNFACTLIYSNLKHDISYLVKESNLDEVSESSKYTVCLNNRVIDIIKVAEQLPYNYTTNARFVAMETSTVKEMGLMNSKIISALISDLLQVSEPQIPIFKINSLRGGSTVGLRMLTE